MYIGQKIFYLSNLVSHHGFIQQMQIDPLLDQQPRFMKDCKDISTKR